MVFTDDALVIYCGGCGNLCFAIFNGPKYIAECADDIAEALKDGGKIAYVSNQTVRENFKRCTCNDEQVEQAQPSLFAA